MVGRQLRETRLKELTGALEETEAGVPLRKVTEWNHEELAEKLTHSSMQEAYCPWIMAEGRWRGGIALRACKFFGATTDLSFGPITGGNVVLVSSALLALIGVEGQALSEARVSPAIQGEIDSVMFRRTLTPEMASEVLQSLAEGTFPSASWGDIYNGR